MTGTSVGIASSVPFILRPFGGFPNYGEAVQWLTGARIIGDDGFTYFIDSIGKRDGTILEGVKPQPDGVDDYAIANPDFIDMENRIIEIEFFTGDTLPGTVSGLVSFNDFEGSRHELYYLNSTNLRLFRKQSGSTNSDYYNISIALKINKRYIVSVDFGANGTIPTVIINDVEYTPAFAGNVGPQTANQVQMYATGLAIGGGQGYLPINYCTVKDSSGRILHDWQIDEGSGTVLYDRVKKWYDDEQLTNSDFSDGLNDWSADVNYSVTGEVLRANAVGLNIFIEQPFPVKVGAKYRVMYKVLENTLNDGTLGFSSQSCFGSQVLDSSVGVNEYELEATQDTSQDFRFFLGAANTSGYITFDYFTVMEIHEPTHLDLNNIDESTFWLTDNRFSNLNNTDGYSRRENLLKYSEEFDESSWVPVANIDLEQSTDPVYDSKYKFEAIANGDAKIQQNLTIEAGKSVKIIAKAGSSDTYLYLWGLRGSGTINPAQHYDLNTGTVLENTPTVSTASITALSDGWYECEFTANIDITNINIEITNTDQSSEADAGDNFYVSRAYATNLDYTKTEAESVPLSNYPIQINELGKVQSTDVLEQTALNKGKVRLNAKAVGSHCGKFDGVDDHIITNVNGTGKDKLIISAKFRNDDTGDFNSHVLDNSPGSQGYSIRLLYTGTEIEIQSFMYLPEALSFRAYKLTPEELNAENHVVSFYDGVNHELYLNGELKQAQTTSGAVVSSANTMAIGSEYSGGTTFNGQIYDVKICNCEVTGEQKDSIVSTGDAADINWLGDFPLAEGAGDMVHSKQEKWLDENETPESYVRNVSNWQLDPTIALDTGTGIATITNTNGDFDDAKLVLNLKPSTRYKFDIDVIENNLDKDFTIIRGVSFVDNTNTAVLEPDNEVGFITGTSINVATGMTGKVSIEVDTFSSITENKLWSFTSSTVGQGLQVKYRINSVEEVYDPATGQITNATLADFWGETQDLYHSNLINGFTEGLYCSNFGTSYKESSQAYGTWEFDINNNTSNSIIWVINEVITTTNDSGYRIVLFSDGTLFFIRRDSGVSNVLFNTSSGYYTLGTCHRIKISRNSFEDEFITGAIGTFAVYIKGGNFGDEYILIDPTGGGTNPVTDNTHTTSNYFVNDLDAGDFISNIKLDNTPLSLHEFVNGTGTYDKLYLPQDPTNTGEALSNPSGNYLNGAETKIEQPKAPELYIPDEDMKYWYGDEMFINRYFDIDSSWTKGVGWTITGGKANNDGTQTATSFLYQDVGIVSDTDYIIKFKVSNYVSGEIKFYFGGGATVGTPRLSDGTFIQIKNSGTVTDTSLYFGASSDFVGSIDEVSVKELLDDTPTLVPYRDIVADVYTFNEYHKIFADVYNPIITGWDKKKNIITYSEEQTGVNLDKIYTFIKDPYLRDENGDIITDENDNPILIN